MSLLLSENFIQNDSESITFFPKKEIVTIDHDVILQLEKIACKSALQRARICLHNSSDSQVQEMIITLGENAQILPHKHINKTESFHILKGSLAVIFFDEEGKITDHLSMQALNEFSDKSCVYRMNVDKWHTVIPLSKIVVLHEIVPGPFDKDHSIYPDWFSKNTEKILKKTKRELLFNNKNNLSKIRHGDLNDL